MADGGRKWLKLAGSVAVTAALCAWAFRNADWAGQWRSLKTAHYGWLVPYVAILLAIHLFRTLRWGALLSGMEKVPFRPLNQASGIGFMMLLILPFRLGEFARPFLIAQRSNLRRSAAMATVVVERITDGLVIAVMLRTLLFFVDSRSPGVDQVLLGSNVLFLVFGGGALFLVFATWQQARAVALVRMTAGKLAPALAEKVAHIVGTFVGAMRQLPPAPQLVLFFVYTLGYWAMNSGKRAIAAGPGNPPAVVDATAHLAQAGRDIVAGASLDNNIVCIVEKEVFAEASIADELKQHMVRAGAYEVTGAAINRLEKLVVVDGHTSKDWVGKDAAKIAEAAGMRVPAGTKLLFAEVDPSHPFVQLELLMPVIGFSRMKTVEDCIAAAVQAEHGFGHTATMHSTNVDHLHEMARTINTSIFVKNGPSFAGLGMTGEGYTSFTIASPTGEGLTTALTFTRERRCTLKDSFRIV